MGSGRAGAATTRSRRSSRLAACQRLSEFGRWTRTWQVTTDETMMQAIIQEAAARHEAKPRFAILELAGVNPVVQPGGRP